MTNILFAARVGAMALLAGLLSPAFAEEKATRDAKVWTVPDVNALPDDARGREIKRGRDLILATFAYIGPQVEDPAMRLAGNNLACGNCHLEAGTKKFGLALFGIYGDFPKYSARMGADISIEDRINSCMTRSMNGRPLLNKSLEMRALVAYVKFLSSGVSPGEKIPGLGAGKMAELDRAADPARGKPIYERACLDCHNTNGTGVPRSPRAMILGYAVPPLWGHDSFNNGAGMARLITLANFLHSNMPHGSDYLDPKLTIEEAWDLAAYVESQERPHKAGLDHDFEKDLLDKPVDAAYGPYADGFSEAQHKYGPYAPIRAEVERLKAEQHKER